MTPMNTERSILKLVEQLCEEEPPSFQWQHLRQIEELSKLERLLALRMLRPTGNASSIWCNACDSVHSVAVEFLEGAATEPTARKLVFSRLMLKTYVCWSWIWQH